MTQGACRASEIQRFLVLLIKLSYFVKQVLTNVKQFSQAGPFQVLKF